MRLQRILAATAALAALTTLATACEDPAKPGPPAASPTATATASAQASPAAGSAPATLAGAQAHVQKYTSCENLSTDPNDRRVALSGFIGAGDWSITERGVCTDKKAPGEIVLFLTPDMKAFQQAAKDHATKLIAEGREDYGLASRMVVGKTFALTALKTRTAVSLVDPPNSDLRILSCNPNVYVPEGFKKEKALVEGCILTDYVNSPDGQGSPFRGAVRDPSTEGTEKPGQPATGSLGLASAGSIAELKKMVHPHTVDCTSMTVTDEHVQSIDYLPVVDAGGNPRTWGVKERAVCGTLGGAQRAHNLNWLDTVSDMKTLQTKAKAAQLADLKDDGRLKATASKLLVGTNVAVETNSKSVRIGLYQFQFLYLNCETGFTAPAGYRLEKAQVEGCVLTNYERQ
ncbi:hypothetical protein [Streptomyces sp. NBC_00091]|uniref:hypothetical protein n=1 Tax=Streptomyces sp. NBC_00091 TaxID=2975648 RepID=UPI0022508E16|nr:hypothetical protein [Streptomyces sp. NBC_00091]MCX5376286.1 hypothetical protein [Streptomyces sp. NBC_00091]